MGENDTAGRTCGLPILSLYEGDDMYESLLGEFVNTLAPRVHEMTEVLRRHDLAEMRRLVHKFRGSAATYGFPQMAGQAKLLDDKIVLLLSEGGKPGRTLPQDFLADYLAFLEICSRVTTFDGQTEGQEKPFTPCPEILADVALIGQLAQV